jgi:glycosyltransferase involved in cell wall biosynthesis
LARFLLANQRRYDVIYARFLGEATITVCVLKALGLVRLPIVSVPGAAGKQGKSDFAFFTSIPGHPLLVHLINNHCECINFINPQIESALRSLGIRPQRSSYIPNGVYLPPQVATLVHDRTHKMIFVGRLALEKGLDVLFLALKRLRERKLPFDLEIIGDGPERSYLEELSNDLNLSDNVHFLGVQDEAAVQAHLFQAHIFVLPSRYEGMSNAALEALACGLPVVLTRCGGVDAYVTSSIGWVCAVEDPEALSDCLVEALRLTRCQWQRMSNACRQLIAERFSLEEVAQNNIEVFQSILESYSCVSSHD